MQREETHITLKSDDAVAWAYVVTGEKIDVIDGECEELLQLRQDERFEVLIDVG
jgi:hypothetical protein